MSNINKDAVLNPFSDLTANILDYIPRATTSEFGIVAIGSGINVDALGRIYLDTQEYSDRLTAIEAQAASSLATQKSEVAAAIAQVNLAQSQTITALTLEVSSLKTNLIDSISATQTELLNRADQLAQNVTDITDQLTQDKAAFTKEIQDALVYLENASSVASALRTPRKIQGVDFDGTQDISLPVFTTQTDGLVPKREGATSTKYLCEDGSWVTPPNTTYASLTQANAEAGTSTTANLISAKVLKDTILYHTPIVTDIAGNAGTATKLQTPRTVGGVSFDGTANINLPGVNTKGNQDTSGNAATASKLQTARTISLTGNVIGSVSFDGSNNASIATAITGLGAANGIATLDSNGQVPSTQLPSYVDDVLEYLNLAAFPTQGESGKIYVETTGNTTYRWGGTAYVKITSGEVSAVAGKTGVVTLTKADVGLDQVDNIPDTQKPISTATQLALNDKVNKADVIDITKGGTGATTAAAARTNLGLGTAATRGVGTQSGNVMEVGAFGVGAPSGFVASVAQSPRDIPAGFRLDACTRSLIEHNGEPFGSEYMSGSLLSVKPNNIVAFNEGHMSQLYISGRDLLIRSGYIWQASNKFEIGWVKFYNEGNTTVDSNGFIKAASPIVKLFTDKVEPNNEAQQQNIEFEKLGVGDYLIKGSSGFAQEGWYVETPKDANGNVLVAVVYEQLENGDISVKTYDYMLNKKGRIVADIEVPLDIPESRWVDLRLQELPQPESEEPQPDATITDYQGSPATSRLHELVDGMWIVSDENAAILEQERLVAMPSLKRRQFRLTLAMNGYDLKEIEALINQIEDPMQRTIAQIEWQDATEFERTNPTLLMMAQMLGLTSEQVDALWEYGLTL